MWDAGNFRLKTFYLCIFRFVGRAFAKLLVWTMFHLGAVCLGTVVAVVAVVAFVVAVGTVVVVVVVAVDVTTVVVVTLLVYKSVCLPGPSFISDVHVVDM